MGIHARPPHLTARATTWSDRGQLSPVLAALRDLLTVVPLADSNAKHFPSHERDYAIVLHELGRARAEAVMANILAFELWRRHNHRRTKGAGAVPQRCAVLDFGR
jgi:hypothetical protein